MAPTNKAQMFNAFFLFTKKDFIDPNSPLTCIRRAISFLSDNDSFDLKKTDVQDYYNKFSGQVNGDKILDRKTFCAEINVEILDPKAKSQPGMYYIEKIQPPKTHISHSMYLYKLYHAGISKNKIDQTEECVRELAVFGPPSASTDEIVELALRKFRITFPNVENAPYGFYEGTFKYEYLEHISEVVTLKDDSKLVTPWDYCYNKYPDEEQENAKPEDQASSSKEENK